MQKGKLPTTEKIVLESTQNQWLLLNARIINYLDCSAVIQRDPESKVRINLRLLHILKPADYNRSPMIAECQSNNKEVDGGFERIAEFFTNWYRETQWIMFGIIQGEKPIPIMIIYIECFNISIYTTRFDRNSLKGLLPQGVHLN